MRGVAIAWVFAFHASALLAGGLSGPPTGLGQAVAEKGLLGVQLFFVLSGFLLALPWMEAARSGSPPPSAWPFYMRRARRILPAYWLHLTLLFGLVLPLLADGFWLLESDLGQLNLWLHPIFAQFAHPGSSSSLGLNMALWSLTLEVQFYLLLPLLAPAFTGRRVLVALPVALALSLVWKTQAPVLLVDWIAAHVRGDLLVYFDPVSGQPLAFPPPVLGFFVERQLPGEFFAFALGMATANLYARLDRGARLSAESGARIGFAGLAILCLVPLLLARVDLQQILFAEAWRLFGMPLFLVSCALVVLAAALGRGLTARVLAAWPLAGLGVLSYSLYLWHEPILRLTAAYASARGASLTIAIGVCASLAAAALSYRLVERPLLRHPSPDYPCAKTPVGEKA
jgi:peptidoglycan/LPS O-acetylase OafA/YrhL